MMGMSSEFSGRSSESENMRTENARKRVIPRETFSPDSGGNQNISRATRDSPQHGNTYKRTH